MDLLKFLKRSDSPIEVKSTIGNAQLLIGRQHSYALTDWQSFAKEGYAKNPTVFSCTNLIQKSFARIPLKVKNSQGEHLPDSDFQRLLNRANLDESGQEMRSAAIGWMMITGNCFMERLMSQGKPSEIYLWQPYQMSVGRVKGSRIPARYIFRKGLDGQKQWDMDLVSGQCDMNHWRFFNPSPDDSTFGMSPLSAAAKTADAYNSAQDWRYNQVKNGGVLDGLLTPKGSNTMDEKQRQSLSRTLLERFKGSARAGNKIGVAATEMTYVSMSQNMRDAEWLGATKLSKLEICETLGVPPQLIGVEGSNTYANYEQANLSFHYQTIIPLVDAFCSELNRWLGEFYPGESVCFDLSDIPALEPERAERRQQKIASGAYSINEIRAEFGDAPRDEIEADYVMTNPTQIPLGMDVFTESEKLASDVAKALIQAGMPRAEAEKKALDWFYDRKD